MNVLLVGPWDLAGKATAEYFLREGHEVCWLTREPRRTLWDPKLRGTVYRGRFEAAQILPVLRAHRVEAVILLTAPVRESGNLPAAEPDDLLGPLLEALRQHPVRCFVYLSSVELSWAGPLTPRQALLAAGELLCTAHRDQYALPLLILRMGYIYGRAEPEDMGVTGAALRDIGLGRDIPCPYHPEDCVDALAAADAAVAVYRMVLQTMTGRYLLVTGHPLPWREYYRCLEQAAGHPARVQWGEQRRTMPADRYSAEAIKAATGWMPFVLLPEGGWQMLRPCPAQPPAPARARRLRLPRPSQLPPALRGVAETLVLFGATCLLLRFSKDVSDLKYVDIRLMFVALTAGCLGSGMGLLAAGLACLSYLYSLAASYVDVSYLLYSVDTWIPFVIYGVTGSVLGYLNGRRREEAEALQRRHRLLEEKYEQLRQSQGQTLEIKNRLQQRIVSERHSFADVYRILRELDALPPDRVLPHTVTIVESLLQCGRAAVYRVDPDTGRAVPVACSAAWQGRCPLPDRPTVGLLCSVFAGQPVFVNTDLVPGRPDLAAAIRCGGRLYAFVAAYGLEPDRFTTYYQDLLKVAVGLVERSLPHDAPDQGPQPACAEGAAS